MFEGGEMIDIGKDLQDAFDDGYRQAMQDRWIPVSEKLPEELVGSYRMATTTRTTTRTCYRQ